MLSRLPILPSCLSLVFALTSIMVHAGYDTHPRYDAFVKEVYEEYQIPEQEVKSWLSQAVKKQSVLDAIQRPAEKTMTWARYQDIFLTKKRISAGKQFMIEHADTLKEAEAAYQVPKEIIAAIIGVETYYGTRKGSYRVLDSLTTLAFDYPKRPLFWRELKAMFALSKLEGIDPGTIKGSYAGAMGYGQFIPTSYLAYAVDADNDGRRDLLNNPIDAIHSVANYFKEHGWKTGELVTQPVQVEGDNFESIVNKSRKPKWAVAKLMESGVILSRPLKVDAPATLMKLEGKQGSEFWLGEYNFYVITQYNHSRLYAMAVYQLSEALK